MIGKLNDWAQKGQHKAGHRSNKCHDFNLSAFQIILNAELFIILFSTTLIFRNKATQRELTSTNGIIDRQATALASKTVAKIEALLFFKKKKNL